VEGLSLLGTSAISEPLSSREQLEAYQTELTARARQFPHLVFCVGENGLDLAREMGINPSQLIKTANWIGPMLVAAGINGVREILLFGYHGKLIKLAGGIFHTHHYLADGRLEILTANLVQLGLSPPDLQQVFNCDTTEAALNYLRDLERQTSTNWVDLCYEAISAKIDCRSQEYIYRHCGQEVKIGSILFDRQRRIIVKSKNAVSINLV
jgi:cobalt-precorrin-5B (C1)-methyltransferase